MLPWKHNVQAFNASVCFSRSPQLLTVHIWLTIDYRGINSRNKGMASTKAMYHNESITYKHPMHYLLQQDSELPNDTNLFDNRNVSVHLVRSFELSRNPEFPFTLDSNVWLKFCMWIQDSQGEFPQNQDFSSHVKWGKGAFLESWKPIPFKNSNQMSLTVILRL